MISFRFVAFTVIALSTLPALAEEEEKVGDFCHKLVNSKIEAIQRDLRKQPCPDLDYLVASVKEDQAYMRSCIQVDRDMRALLKKKNDMSPDLFEFERVKLLMWKQHMDELFNVIASRISLGCQRYSRHLSTKPKK